jgi:hypothetical protein
VLGSENQGPGKAVPWTHWVSLASVLPFVKCKGWRDDGIAPSGLCTCSVESGHELGILCNVEHIKSGTQKLGLRYNNFSDLTLPPQIPTVLHRHFKNSLTVL